MNDRAGKLVVLTGASSGLERACAVAFAGAGATVVLVARRAAALEETARLCRAAGGRARCVVTDATCEADVETLVREA